VFRRILIVLAALFALGLLGSLSLTSVTAHAQPMPYPPVFLTNSVKYVQTEDSLKAHTKLYNTSPRGIHSTQKLGTTANNVRTSCPKNDRIKLMWSVVGSSKVTILEPGQCMFLRDRTGYVVVALSAR